MKTIGKAYLIADVSQSTRVTKQNVELVIDQMVDTIMSYTNAGHKVTLRGFGTFEVKTRAARTLKNPRTGEPVQVPERQALTFKASKGA